jgi:hypothetical protein
MTTGIASFLTFLLGLLLGNRLALDRDKRKEFNEAAEPIRDWLLRDKDAPSPCAGWPSVQEFDRFEHHLRPWQRAAFARHLNQFKAEHEAAQVRDEYGGVRYGDDSAIRRELNQLFPYTSPR